MAAERRNPQSHPEAEVHKLVSIRIPSRRDLEFVLARQLFNMPPRVQIRLSGRPQIQLDGQRLHPEMQLVLAAQRWSRRHFSLRAADVRRARADMRESILRYADAPEVASVRDLQIAGPGGPLTLRHYAPREAGPRPLLVFLHGGGFALGDLDTHDLPCRLLCRSAASHVLSVDYRLAPEHPFPAAPDDAWAALLWAHAHAAELGADPARIAIGGDSAGGNLAAVVAQRVARQGGPALKAQLLIYPLTDRVEERPSRKLFASEFLLTRADIAWFDQHYAAHVPTGDPRVSPLRAADLSGLCPALVVSAGFDPLRDETEEYAQALEAAGNHVVFWREPQLLHGYIQCAGVSPKARHSVTLIGERLRNLLEA